MSLNVNVAVGLSIVALAVGAFALSKPVPTVQVGGASAPSIVDGCITVEGVQTCYRSQKMALASTTCSFAAPKGGDSVLVDATATVNAAPLGTTQYEWGIAATAYATTTSAGRGVLAAAAQGTLVASSTQLNTGPINDPTTVIPEGTYVNLKVGTSTPTGQSGTCYAVFRTFRP